MDEHPEQIFPVTHFTNSSEKIDRYEIINRNQHQKQMSLWDELNLNDIHDDEYNVIEEKELQRQQEEEENEIRASWKINDYVLIYSRSKDQWTDGKIVRIDGTNKTNEWLIVRYGKTKKKTKKIQRNCQDIKLIPHDHPIHFDAASLCLIYSYDVEEWCDGEVENIFTDAQGEWMKVK
eukprot:267764_1